MIFYWLHKVFPLQKSKKNPFKEGGQYLAQAGSFEKCNKKLLGQKLKGNQINHLLSLVLQLFIWGPSLRTKREQIDNCLLWMRPRWPSSRVYSSLHIEDLRQKKWRSTRNNNNNNSSNKNNKHALLLHKFTMTWKWEQTGWDSISTQISIKELPNSYQQMKVDTELEKINCQTGWHYQTMWLN